MGLSLCQKGTKSLALLRSIKEEKGYLFIAFAINLRNTFCRYFLIVLSAILINFASKCSNF